MTDTFEHKKRLSEKQFANDSRQAGNETTPKAISEPILAFAKALGGDSAQLVPVTVRRRVHPITLSVSDSFWGGTSELVARLSAALPDAWHVPRQKRSFDQR